MRRTSVDLSLWVFLAFIWLLCKQPFSVFREGYVFWGGDCDWPRFEIIHKVSVTLHLSTLTQGTYCKLHYSSQETGFQCCCYCFQKMKAFWRKQTIMSYRQINTNKIIWALPYPWQPQYRSNPHEKREREIWCKISANHILLNTDTTNLSKSLWTGLDEGVEWY